MYFEKLSQQFQVGLVFNPIRQWACCSTFGAPFSQTMWRALKSMQVAAEARKKKGLRDDTGPLGDR